MGVVVTTYQALVEHCQIHSRRAALTFSVTFGESNSPMPKQDGVRKHILSCTDQLGVARFHGSVGGWGCLTRIRALLR